MSAYAYSAALSDFISLPYRLSNICIQVNTYVHIPDLRNRRTRNAQDTLQRKKQALKTPFSEQVSVRKARET